MDHKRDSDHHPSKKKCNQHDCQKSKGWYVHKTLMPTRNYVINNQDIQSFTCKTWKNNFVDKNEREHPRNIVCKYFLKNTCRRIGNQRALCWFRYDQLPLSAPNVANAAPGVATSVSPLWNTNFPLLLAMSQSLSSGLQQQMVTMIQQQKLQQQQQQQQHQEQMRMMMTQMMNMNM